MADEHKTDEIDYLMNMEILPQIPDYIQEKFDGVMEVFTAYASRAHLDEGVLASEQDLIRRSFIFAFNITQTS